MKNSKPSKHLAYILRHSPSAAGVTLDEHGWANVAELLKGIGKTHKIDFATLEQIVAEDEKGRFSFNADKTKIRANQGHSVNVNPDLTESVPPKVLYHGTAEKYVLSITNQGLLPRSRQYVHLSMEFETAVNVGRRHGVPVVFAVDCAQMVADGYKFYISQNNVWLTKCVPRQYLTLLFENKN